MREDTNGQIRMELKCQTGVIPNVTFFNPHKTVLGRQFLYPRCTDEDIEDPRK